MKTQIITTLLALSLGFNFSARAAGDHKHEHAKTGPTGGKLITAVEPHVEFLVTKDKKVELRFVNDDNKVVAPAAQVISVTLGERSAPTKLAFTKDGNKLVSDKVIPAGTELPTVVQIREKEGAKAINAKFNLNLNKCPTCSNPEYACTCAHTHEDEKK